MAQAAVYFLLLISILPLLQAAQCPGREYCPVGLDCSEDKDLCEPRTCSESANGSNLCNEGISVSFSQPSYNVLENAGLAQPVLILSKAMNCCNFHVRINVRDITAKDTVDYQYTPRRSGQITVIIPAGRTSVSFDVTILDDIIIEEDIESFQLSIVDVSLPHDVSVGSIQNATVNIIDDDYACVDFERTTYTVRENDRSGSVLAAIILSRPTAIDIPIRISTVDIDTSTVECDYEYGPYDVVFTNENKRTGTQRATFRVHIIDDDVYEENERFNLVIDYPVHNRISRCYPYRSTVTIQSDESLTYAYFDKTSMTVDEDIGTISPVLKLDKPSPCCITVLVELKELTATGRGIDYDYQPPQTPMFYEYTFSAGDTCATPDRPIPIVDDKESDENERFEIRIVDDSVPYGVRIRGRDYVTVTIKDNDINLCFDQNEFIVDENEAEVTIKMSIDERPPEDFIVTIRDDPINAFGFYSPGPYNITIKKNHYPSRKIEFSIRINAKDPRKQCTGNKIFNLTIECPSSPEGVAPCLDRGTTKVIIKDHESGNISFVRKDYKIRKNQALPTKPQLRFHGRPLFRAVVNVDDRQNMSETGHATGGEDYEVRDYEETFTLGSKQNVETINLTVIPYDDNIVEDDETYYLDIVINADDGYLAGYPCISVVNRTASITIVNDDLVIVKIEQKQGGSEELIFTRSLKFDTDVTIFYDGYNETHTVDRGDPFRDQVAPTVQLQDGYEKIMLHIHPAVYDYVRIQDKGIISMTKKRLM